MKRLLQVLMAVAVLAGCGGNSKVVDQTPAQEPEPVQEQELIQEVTMVPEQLNIVQALGKIMLEACDGLEKATDGEAVVSVFDELVANYAATIAEYRSEFAKLKDLTSDELKVLYPGDMQALENAENTFNARYTGMSDSTLSDEQRLRVENALEMIAGMK